MEGNVGAKEGKIGKIERGKWTIVIDQSGSIYYLDLLFYSSVA